MGRIAKLLSFVRNSKNGTKVSDVKVDPGGGPNITAEHFASPGDDSNPLPGDYVALSSSTGAGRESAIGYLDPLNEPKALSGDKRIYARDADGVAVVELWLKNTGDAILSNTNGSLVLLANGTVMINGVSIDKNGNVTIPNSLTLGGKEIAGHLHLAGEPPGNTGPNQ